ncbi:TIGR03067 domain-containing protein [Haliscomenobacter sp.]|uniref:TIGR03067 domain-containing protein n=1 Tax=Haliscomenobacter sp. TaxID=2717303 RepID=UPI003BAC19E0
MRLISFIMLILLMAGCASTKNTSVKNKQLNGTWLPIKQEIGGKAFPAAVYQNQKLVIKDSTYTVVAESVDKGIVKFNGNKMDIYGKEGVNVGKHFTAIYKLENDELTICYNLAGNAYPEAFETTGKMTFFLSVFKKERK